MEKARQIELFYGLGDGHAESQRQLMQAHLRGLLMDIFLDEQPVPRLLQITALVPPHCRKAWHLVSNTLLANRLKTGSGGAQAGGAHQAWIRQLRQQWEQPTLLQRWHRLLDELTPGQGLKLVKQARRRGLVH